MRSTVVFELDGREVVFDLMEFKKCETKADMWANRPTAPLYNGKSYNWNLRCALRQSLREAAK